MNNGICSKCLATDIYVSDAGGEQHGMSINRSSPFMVIYKDNKWIPDVTMIALAYYVCAACGAFEMRVREIADLAPLDGCSNWRRVEY